MIAFNNGNKGLGWNDIVSVMPTSYIPYSYTPATAAVEESQQSEIKVQPAVTFNPTPAITIPIPNTVTTIPTNYQPLVNTDNTPYVPVVSLPLQLPSLPSIQPQTSIFNPTPVSNDSPIISENTQDVQDIQSSNSSQPSMPNLVTLNVGPGATIQVPQDVAAGVWAGGTLPTVYAPQASAALNTAASLAAQQSTQQTTFVPSTSYTPPAYNAPPGQASITNVAGGFTNQQVPSLETALQQKLAQDTSNPSALNSNSVNDYYAYAQSYCLLYPGACTGQQASALAKQYSGMLSNWIDAAGTGIQTRAGSTNPVQPAPQISAASPNYSSTVVFTNPQGNNAPQAAGSNATSNTPTTGTPGQNPAGQQQPSGSNANAHTTTTTAGSGQPVIVNNTVPTSDSGGFDFSGLFSPEFIIAGIALVGGIYLMTSKEHR